MRPSFLRRLAVLVPVVLLALSPLASAAPTPGVEQFATVGVTLTAGRHTWTLSVDAIAPTAASPLSAPRVRLTVQDGPPSSGTPTTVYETVLRVSDVSVGTDTASLVTRLGGLPVHIDWKVPRTVPNGIVLSAAVVGAARIAGASVEVGTTSCYVRNGEVGVRAASLQDLQSAVGPLQRAFPVGSLRGLRCAPAVYPAVP